MKQKIFTLLLGALFVTYAFAQKPTAEIEKATTAPVIDGIVDEVWATAPKNNIDQPFQAEVPTLGAAGETTWQALWTADGIYILLTVTDDAHLTSAINGSGNPWDYDKAEIYFDANYVLEDGGAPANGNGHYQVAPDLVAPYLDGTPNTQDDGVVYTFMVSDPNWIAEYFVPFSKLLDSEGVEVDKQGNIGFDVTVIDRDPGDDARKRAVWANVGAINESWSNMDDCGIITLKGADAKIYVESITLTGGAITEDNGTFQVVAEILPADATTKNLKWSIDAASSTGKASVDNTGLVTAIADGDVTVKAEATDGSYEEATCVVSISGQTTTLWELNVIKNGDFTMVEDNQQATFWGGWGGNDNAPLPTVIDGVAVCTPVVEATPEVWTYQFNQQNLTAIPNVDYIFTFKAWADAGRTFNVDFEDHSGNNYNRYGATTDARSGDGRSDWTFDITTDPTWYTFDVNFDQVVDNTIQKVQYMLGLDASVTYIDSVLLVTLEEWNTLSVPNEFAASKVRVYPNPAGDNSMVTVLLPEGQCRVTIYDSVGRKVEEITNARERAVVNVSSYARGMYFVKVNDEPVVKFIK